MLGPVFFRTALPCPVCYHLERGGMPLRDLVGVNCRKAQLLKIKARCPVYVQRGVCWMFVCVLSDFT